MYGFKPRHAQGKPVQNLADGGIVHSLTGMLGMRKRTPEEMLAADAKVQERNREAAARVAARATPAQPAAPAEEKAVSSYAGMSAMQRREKELGLKDGGIVGGFKPGGLIRGPGTGTSDSIETEKRPGTFIMPADSTQAIGPEALEELGEVDDSAVEEQGEKVPVRLSNGEFELPPEQVQALGEAVLTVLRDATHTPTGSDNPTSKGFAPNQFFANGGTVFGSRGLAGLREVIPKVQAMGYPQAQQPAQAPAGSRDLAALKAMIPKMEAMGYPQALADGGTVQDEEKKRLANQTAMYVRGAQEAAANRPAEPPAAPVPAPTPAQPSEYSRQMSAVGGALADGAAWLGKTIVSAPGYGFSRPSAAPAPAPAPAVSATTTAGAGRGAINPAPATPNQPSTAAPAPSNTPPDTAAAPTQQPTNEVMPGVYRHGRGQYSDNASGMDFTSVPGSGGQGSPVGKTVEQAQREGLVGERVGYNPAYDQRLNGATGISAQNMAAADALQARQTPAGFQPTGSQPAGVQAPVVRNSTNDWAARNNLRNLEVSASSITNQPGFSRGGRGYVPPAVAAYQAGLQTDAALQQAQPGMDQTAMRENAGIQREGLQQDGATTRTGMTEQGANAREAGRNALAQGEFGLKKEAAGFQTRAAAQQEQLRNVLLDPKSTPEQRAVAQRNLAALSGKTAADRMQTVALPDTTNEMGQVVRGGQALVRVLEDGTVQQVPIGAQQAPAPIAAPKAGEVRNGYRFNGGNPNDQANWKKV